MTEPIRLVTRDHHELAALRPRRFRMYDEKPAEAEKLYRNRFGCDPGLVVEVYLKEKFRYTLIGEQPEEEAVEA